jgi:uncharacterized protein YndB with AHSA1/START domain
MPSYEETIEVEVPREEAFDYVADLTTAPEWDPGIRSSKQLDEGPTRVGSAFEVVAEFRGKPQTFRYEVLELDPGRRLVIRGESEKAISDDTITFADAGGETVITYGSVLRLKGISRVAEPFLAGTFAKLGKVALEGLERTLASR